MIQIHYQQKKEEITLLKIEGHANFDEHGNDIVCAAVSCLSGLIGRTLSQLPQTELNLEASEGYFLLEWPLSQKESSDRCHRFLLRETFLAIQELSQHYSGFISIKENP